MPRRDTPGHSGQTPRGQHSPQQRLPRQTKPTGKLETPLPHATPGTNFAWEGVTALDAESNYFLGSDPAKWRTHVKHFAAAEAKNVLPGVDILAYGNSEGMEYDLRVAPGADAQNLRLEIATAGAGQPPNMRVDTLGDLIVTFDGREMRMKKPAIYEEWAATESHPAQRKEISGGYDLEADASVAFRVGKHDPRATLVLDPSLTVSYATFLGGTGNDTAQSLALDSSGNVYVGGTTTLASTFPEGSPRLGPAGSSDFFIAKINPAKMGRLRLCISRSSGAATPNSAGSLPSTVRATRRSSAPALPWTIR
jgi:hypothetical protein